jgi:hypothetical protein
LYGTLPDAKGVMVYTGITRILNWAVIQVARVKGGFLVGTLGTTSLARRRWYWIRAKSRMTI